MEQGLNKEQLEKQVLQHQKALWEKLGFPYKGKENEERAHERMVDDK